MENDEKEIIFADAISSEGFWFSPFQTQKRKSEIVERH